MAAAACLLSEQQFLCSICLDVFNTPVTIPCGHNFCKSCITENWRINRKRQCPMCKKFFDTGTRLHVNTFISEMAFLFRQSAEKQASKEAEQGEVPCDACTGIKQKALKSCLVCLASYCGAHLERHRTVSGLKKHKLIEPLDNLEEKICTKHNEVLKLFCKSEQVCVCQCCAESDHASHDVVPMEETFEVKKTELGKPEAEFQKLILERQLKIKHLQWSEYHNQKSADKETEHGVQVFTTLKQFFDTGLTELIQQIRKRQNTVEKQAGDLINELDWEISELTKRNVEVEQRSSDSGDHHQLLQNFSSLNASLPTKDWTNISLRQLLYEGNVARAVAQLKKKLNKEMEKLLKAELKRVRRYFVDVAFDPATAHPKLHLSDNGKQVRHSHVERNVPNNPERFSYCVIVLGKQSFSSDRFYYEVEVENNTTWDLGVISASANRKGPITPCAEAGYWILQLRSGMYVALNDPDVFLPLKSQPQTVGVFVDYEEGLVSFYDVDTADIIYTFTDCCFTERLYPLFSPCIDNSGDNSVPLWIPAVHKTE